jgi:threonine/homoserine/homoserine lactone efflux protein
VTGNIYFSTEVGVSAALIAYSEFVVAVKISEGLYLLWLGFRSGRNALAATAASGLKVQEAPKLTSVYSRGLMPHLTNPKAILVWVSIVALSSNNAGSSHSALIPGCAAIGCLVFGGYAVLFSTAPACRIYVRSRRALEGCLAAVFGIAGIRLLASLV